MKTNKLTIAAAAAALSFSGFAGTAAAAEASVGLDFASAYVFRGETFNDGWVAQPYLEVGGEGLAGFTLGVWANADLESSEALGVDGGNVSEIDLYAVYDIPLDLEDVGLSLGYTEYTYPYGGGEADREVSAAASFDVVSAPYLALYYGVDGGIESDFYAEAGVSHSWDLEEGVSLGIGGLLGFKSPDEGSSGLSHGLISADIGWNVLSASVNYVIETDSDVLLVDEDLYFTVGAGYDF